MPGHCPKDLLHWRFAVVMLPNIQEPSETSETLELDLSLRKLLVPVTVKGRECGMHSDNPEFSIQL